MSPSRGNLDETEGERAHCPCPQPCSGRPLGPRWMGSLVVTDSFSRMEQEMPGGQGCLCTSSSKRFYLALDR